MLKFSVNDILSGKVSLETGANSYVGRIRDIVAEVLREKGQACEFSELVGVVRKRLELEHPQMVYNYVGNALRNDPRFYCFKYGSKRLVVRVDGDTVLRGRVVAKYAGKAT